MPTKTISVTQNDIRKGVRKFAELCPIARALEKAGFHGPSVSNHKLLWIDGSGVLREMNPTKKLCKFMDDFDAGEPVRPITFQLRWKK